MKLFIIYLVISLFSIPIASGEIKSEIPLDNLVKLANEMRLEAGCITPLVMDSQLDKASQERVVYVSNGHWTHEGNWGTIRKYYKDDLYLGENLAKYIYNDSGIIKAWLNSPTHKEVLLDCRYNDAGVSRFSGYTALLLGKRK